MKKTMKIHWLAAGLLVCIGSLPLCGCAGEKAIQKVTVVEDLYCDDSKFYGDAIISSENYKLAVIGLEGQNIRVYEEIDANWIDGIAEEGIIVYGNINQELGIVRLDENYNLLSRNVVMQSEHLLIDPSVTKWKDSYYMTVTEIEGIPNNGDVNSENGHYTIRFYQSDDLLEWKPVSEVVSCNHNLEDVELFVEDGIFHVIYEKETLDGADSWVMLQKSKDSEGKEWEEPIVLLENTCDNEPACMEKKRFGGYRLYYSCDKDKPGQSYMGAKMYYAEYDHKFRVKRKDVEIPSHTEDGILLYDVKEKDGVQRFLFCKNYYTDHSLVIEERK